MKHLKVSDVITIVLGILFVGSFVANAPYGITAFWGLLAAGMIIATEKGRKHSNGNGNGRS